MKLIRNPLVIGAVAVVLLGAVSLSIQTGWMGVFQAVEGETATVSPVTETSVPLPTSETRPGILTEDLLLETAYWAAVSQGMDPSSTSVAKMDASQGIYTLYKWWVGYMGDDPEPEPGMIGAENAARPVFIMPVVGHGVYHQRFPTITPEPEIPIYAYIVVIFADNGFHSGTQFVPEGRPIPDLSALRNKAILETTAITPVPTGLVPVPAAPTEQLRKSS